MYDDYLPDNTYRRFKDMVIDFVNGDSSREADAILSLIERSYEDGDLSTGQYDHLMRILSDYEEE